MTVFDGLQGRDCPVCDRPERDATPFLAASIDPDRIGSFSFASRKLPEYMSFRLVRCGGCTTIYAADAPHAESLAMAYEVAGYDSAEEAVFAAATYARELEPTLTERDLAGTALEIGTGTGVFLRELKRLGFADVIGIEPSTAAIAVADSDVKAMIQTGVFTAADHIPESLSLICCFQTLEHVTDPKTLTDEAFGLLRPGGVLAFVTHDYNAPINRALGRRSPIIDVEHMQLFCPESLRHLVSHAGFEAIAITKIRNTYPLRYWLRLIPIPSRLKAFGVKVADMIGLGHRPISFDVGNLLTVARKPIASAR